MNAMLDLTTSQTTVTSTPPFLGSSEVIDHESDAVQAFVDKYLPDSNRIKRLAAVKLYYAVRDGIFYEIFGTELGDKLSASTVIREKRGFCLHKAILYAALCRAVGIRSRVLAAPVCNHVSSPSIGRLVGGDVFLHWYNEIRLDRQWLKVAPIFNNLMCRLYKIAPLEFDGYSDAYRQPYVDDMQMTYLKSPVVFDNPSRSELITLVHDYHPRMIGAFGRVPTEKQIANTQE